jgi:phospholipid/cholesterol/gamma-HCH transport system substrate-binding protein
LVRSAALAVAVLLGVSGCSLELLSAPTGSLHLTARFDDVTDLGPGHTVRVANVVVGSVTDVGLDGYRAEITMSISDGHRIPAGSTATIKRTSLLGEPYVELAFPDGVDPTTARALADGNEITATGTEASVEDLAGRAGALVAAVDPDDLASTIQASAQALSGNGPQMHQLVAQLSDLVGALDAQHVDLASTLDNLATLGSDLAPLDDRLGALIDDASSITHTLGADTDKLVTALGAFNDLAAVTRTGIIEPHEAQLAALLRDASVVVGSLANNQAVLARMADSFANFVPRIARAISHGQLLVFTWVDTELRLGGQPLGAVLPAGLAQLVDG